MADHISPRNLRFLSEIIALGISQSAVFSRFSKASLHCAADHVVLPKMMVIRLKNLQDTDIATSNPSVESGKFKMKSIVIVWKGIGDVKMDCRESYGACLLIWYA